MFKVKRILSMTLVCVLLFGMLSSVYAAPSSWAESFLKSMLLEDLISDSVSDSNLFQQDITREEFAELMVIIYAKAEDESVDDYNSWNPFADTNNPMVAKAYNLGIVSGVGKDNLGRLIYAPNNKVTRQEMAVMMVKVMSKTGINTYTNQQMAYSDRDQISAWALDAMRFVVEIGALTGIGNNKIGPLDNATREQALVTLNKIAVRYNWITNDQLTAKFNDSNSRTVSGYRLPNYDQSQLRAYNRNNEVTYIISYLVSDNVVDIKAQQKDLINILATNSTVSFEALRKLRTHVLECYDFTAGSFKTQSTVYIELSTGNQSTYKPSTPCFEVGGTGELRLTYHN